MRNPRAKDSPVETAAYYHLISRTVAGEFLFEQMEKEMLRRHLWLVAERCGIEVLTYAVMSNHFHVVVHAPKRVPLSDAELLRRYALLHTGGSEWEGRELDQLREMLAADGEEAAEWRAREMAKMGDISAYMKLLKQRYSIWYNQSHSRFGTLWAERFRSVQLESGIAVARTVAYVDLNPVRAGLCRDPKDYRFCGYAEAVAGNTRARAGIANTLAKATWTEAQTCYRLMLFVRAARSAKCTGDGPESKVAALNEELTLAEQLRCRCRYLADGAVLGSAAFVQEKLGRFRRLTGRGKRMEPQPAAGAASGLSTLHKLWIRTAAI